MCKETKQIPVKPPKVVQKTVEPLNFGMYKKNNHIIKMIHSPQYSNHLRLFYQKMYPNSPEEDRFFCYSVSSYIASLWLERDIIVDDLRSIKQTVTWDQLSQMVGVLICVIGHKRAGPHMTYHVFVLWMEEIPKNQIHLYSGVISDPKPIYLTFERTEWFEYIKILLNMKVSDDPQLLDFLMKMVFGLPPNEYENKCREFELGTLINKDEKIGFEKILTIYQLL
jgi:hypothetical protein